MSDAARTPENFAFGAKVPPPYFFGIREPGIEKAVYDDPFNTEGWIDHCRDAAEHAGIRYGAYLGNPSRSRWLGFGQSLRHLVRTPARATRLLRSGSSCPNYLLPVTRMIQEVYERRGAVRIVDIGGGFGDNFFEMLSEIRRDVLASLDYSVVDNERSCEFGRQLFGSYQVRPTFISDHASLTPGFDIVLLIGTLQYIAEWRAALRGLAGLSTRHFYIARSPISASRDFSTTQLICPAYGSYAHRNLGATSINVIALGSLQDAMPDDWKMSLSERNIDYSRHFSRLPEEYRDAAYYNLAWQR